MAVRSFKPTTPGQRHKIIGTYEEITASVPEKSLVWGKRSTGGRNNQGKMTMRYMGGGHKRKYRFIDFKREKEGVPATVTKPLLGVGLRSATCERYIPDEWH
jgi:large subunit ribosomal protein L2